MHLVPRKILFELLSNKKPIQLLETENKWFNKVCTTATAQYKKIKSSNGLTDEMMDEFSAIMLDFFNKNTTSIKYVDQGSSRIVFDLCDGTALKMAKTLAGIAQNKQEARVCMNPVYKYEIFPDFYDVDKDHWLVLNCELCAKAEVEDFKRLLHMPQTVLMYLIEFIIENDVENGQYPELLNMYENAGQHGAAHFIDNLMNNGSRAFDAIRSLIEFYREFGGKELLYQDLQTVKNWGLAIRDGEQVLVVIDAGFNEEVLNQYYS